MILLNKKRIILFLIILFMSIIIYLIFFNDNQNTKSIFVSNVDLNKKVVIVDARSRCTRLWCRESKWSIRSKYKFNNFFKIKRKIRV